MIRLRESFLLNRLSALEDGPSKYTRFFEGCGTNTKTYRGFTKEFINVLSAYHVLDFQFQTHFIAKEFI